MGRDGLQLPPSFGTGGKHAVCTGIQLTPAVLLPPFGSASVNRSARSPRLPLPVLFPEWKVFGSAAAGSEATVGTPVHSNPCCSSWGADGVRSGRNCSHCFVTVSDVSAPETPLPRNAIVILTLSHAYLPDAFPFTKILPDPLLLHEVMLIFPFRMSFYHGSCLICCRSQSNMIFSMPPPVRFQLPVSFYNLICPKELSLYHSGTAGCIIQ